MEDKKLHIIHFNDVYDISKASPFVHRVTEMSSPDSLTVFSGDIYFPSLESTVKGGFQMNRLLEDLNVRYSIPGNHDLEKGEAHLIKLIEANKIKWLLSNYKSKATGMNLGNCCDYDIVTIEGVKVGLFGIIDLNWIETSEIQVEHYYLEDFVEKAKTISSFLKKEGCEVIIAITHMKNQDDEYLLEAENDIDIVLGGHDHVYMIKKSNNKLLLKSGTNFENFTSIMLTLSNSPLNSESKNPNEPNTNFFYFIKGKNNSLEEEYRFSLKRSSGYLNFELTPVTIAPTDPKSVAFDTYLDELEALLGSTLKTPLCKIINELDTRSSACRLKENALANLITDLVRAELGVDFVFLSGGHIRADTLYPAEHILTLADLSSLLPWKDCFWVSEATGEDIKIILEQSYRSLPNSAGNFLQVSGLQVTIDASKEPMERLSLDRILVDGKPIEADRKYRIAALSFISMGKDGFSHFLKMKIIGLENKKVDSFNLLLNYFSTANEPKGHLPNSNSHFKIGANALPIEMNTNSKSIVDLDNVVGLTDDKHLQFEDLVAHNSRHIKEKITICDRQIYAIDIYPEGRINIIGLKD